MRAVLLFAVLFLAVGCGGEDEPPATSTRDCFAVWNGPGNDDNRARIVEERKFEVATVGSFRQISGYGEGSDKVDPANTEREGCSYLFHTDHGYVTFSGTWEGDELHWDASPTSGSWSLEQDASAADNAEVAPGGTLRKRAQPAPPSGAPPTAPLEPPPPAWIETRRGSFWLGYSTFCWHSGCADYGGPSCSAESRHVPKLVLDRGEIVHAHLGFTPRRVNLVALSESGSLPGQALDHRLLPSPEKVTWRADRGGPLVLSAVARRGEGGDASYVACVELR